MHRILPALVALLTLCACGDAVESPSEQLETTRQHLSPFWKATGSTAVGHMGGQAVRLNDGRVLLTGGTSSGTVVATAELYTPATGTWTLTGAMARAREDFSLTLLPNGKVLAAGGTQQDGTRLTSCELYDPATGTWTATGSLPDARGLHTATLLPDGRVLLVGGGGSDNVNALFYDPATGTWTPTAMPRTPRSRHTATLLPDGRVFVAGGASDGWTTTLGSAELYSPATGLWTAASPMPRPRADHVAVLVRNGIVQLIGGNTNVDAGNISQVGEMDRYNPATNQWTGNWGWLSPRAYLAATVFPSGKVLLTGGGSEMHAYVSTQTDLLDALNGINNSSEPDMRTARTRHVSVLLSNGQVLVTGYGQTADLYIDPALDDVPPSVSIQSPANGSVVFGTVTLSTSASDNVAIEKVEFYCDTTLIGTSTQAPFSLSWSSRSVGNGAYTLTAKAYDSAGNSSTSAPTPVTLDNDTSRPTVAFTSPSAGATVSGSVTLAANASDDRGVVRVEFYVDDKRLASDSTPPYAVAWNSLSVPEGTHTLRAWACDAQGNSTWTAYRKVTVDNDRPPATRLTSPAEGATLSGSVTLAAEASDDIGVTRVDFYVNTLLVATDTTAPYSVSWSSPSVDNGSYVLSTKAYDAVGNVTQSAGVNVTVSNVNQLINGGFEAGASPWVLRGSSWQSSTAGNHPRGGTGNLLLGGANNVVSGGTFAYQEVFLRSSVPFTGPTLSLWVNVDSQESTAYAYDFLDIELRDAAGGHLTLLGTLTNQNKTPTGSYMQVSYVLPASYVGRTVRVVFKAKTDSSVITTFRIDDVSLR